MIVNNLRFYVNQKVSIIKTITIYTLLSTPKIGAKLIFFRKIRKFLARICAYYKGVRYFS